MFCGEWKENYSNPNRCIDISVCTLDSASILDKGTSKECSRDLLSEPTFAAMTFGSITVELLLTRHLTRFGKTFKNKVAKKNEKW